MKFNADYAIGEGGFGQIFYNKLRPSITLWINEIS